MGEIKSTMDLVMERTKHLSMSSDEKNEIKQAEFEQKIKGILTKYTSGSSRFSEAEKALEPFYSDHKSAATQVLAGFITLQGSNTPTLELLEGVFGVDVSKITEILSSCEEEVKVEKEKHLAGFAKNLAETSSISGSAVVPFIDFDKSWIEADYEICSKFASRLDKAKEELA